MSIFSKGDEVKLKDNLVLYKRYNIFIYTENRAKYECKVLKITEVNHSMTVNEGIENYYYKFKESYNYFSAEMLEYAVKLTKKQRISKVNKIVKEIKANKDYVECFEDIDKEVNSWSDGKINKW